MHHMKRSSRAPTTPSVSRFDFSDAKTELRTRLRFQNKKPLCLQYNLSASQRTKKVMERMKRRNCDSFVKTFFPYLVTLFCTIVELHYRVVDFLVKPVDDFEKSTPTSTLSSPPSSPILTKTKSFDFPASISPPSSPKLVRQGSTSSSSSRKKSIKKTDFGRTARIEAQRNRMTELYVMP
uniref:Uncharacterized protein n=1 Tax=Panagrolaimus sp. ES5 TaxID=591445 RepID=A0AC34G1Z0_9BILA